MIRAVLVTHRQLGCELIRTMETILGPQNGVLCLSNAGDSLEGLCRKVEDELGESRDPVFLFVDLLGGSCGQICRMVRENRPDTTVVSGVNLPMLIEFFYNRDRVPRDELITRVVTKGREGICVQ